jgi:SAM-dependent methyltransferase
MSAQMWDLVAAAYAAEVVPMFETFAAEALTRAELDPGVPVVDVACGPGTLARLAARAGHPVEAIDFSPKMIALVDALGEGAIHARVGDGEALPYESGAFGGGFSMFGLFMFADRAKGFTELRRVLRPNAKAVVTSWPGLDDAPVLSAMLGAMRDAMERKGLHIPGPPPGPPALTTRDELYREMSEAFREVEISTVTHTALFPSVAELAASLGRTFAPVVSLRDAFGAARFAPVDAAMADAIARTIGDAQPKLVMPALFGVGKA